jgi:hypothetical protein
MDAPVVGVAGDEVLLRWLGEVKNTEEHGAAVHTPAKLQQTPAWRQTKLGGGARRRGEYGGAW